MMSGNPPYRPPSARAPGLIRGVLDFELDIGAVGDVDLDYFALQSLSNKSDTLNAGPAGPDFETSAFNLPISNWLSIQGGQFGQALFVGDQRVALPPEWKNPDFPFVRSLPGGRILVSDTSFESAHQENTWILDRTGKIEARFAIGSAAVEICPLDGGLIAVAYHPLSAKRFGHKVEPQQRTAIAFFDGNGRMLTSFNHQAGLSKTFAENVRCMTRISSTEVLFAPERLVQNGEEIENPVVICNCANRINTVISMPYGFPEAISLSIGPNGTPWILVASPEGFEDQVIAFDPARKISQYLGSFVGIFRGLTDSRAKFVRPLELPVEPSTDRGIGRYLWQTSDSASDVSPVSGGAIEEGSSRIGAGKPYGKEDRRSLDDWSNRFLQFNAGGFLAQEVVAEYQWVLADPVALEAREKVFFEDRETDFGGPFI